MLSQQSGALAMNHADRVLVLGEGRLIADGPPEAALTPAVIARTWGVDAAWVGEPGACALVLLNRLDLRLAERSGEA